jgi:hypothetical protein
MKRILRQTIRGCGALPYVGSHPGIGALLLFIGLGFCAAAHRDGWLSGLFFAGCIAAAFGPLCLLGAYGRAQDSDAWVRDDKKRQVEREARARL